ncbi:MAG: D-glycero-beta-D-manno-heptose 1,7-bisphosphate 7-phosphatase [Promethearchaeota archaeon]
MMINTNKAIFLDRDGVINEEVSHLSDPDNFKFIEGSIEAIRILKNLGYLLIVITNQAGIARGYFSEETLNEIHNKMKRILYENNLKLDDIFYCPHHPDFTGPCNCRKPNPGMILKAKEIYNINLRESFMVGDTLKDIETGIAAECQTVLVLTGYGKEEREKINKIIPDFIFDNLLEFAKNIKIDSKL